MQRGERKAMKKWALCSGQPEQCAGNRALTCSSLSEHLICFTLSKAGGKSLTVYRLYIDCILLCSQEECMSSSWRCDNVCCSLQPKWLHKEPKFLVFFLADFCNCKVVLLLFVFTGCLVACFVALLCGFWGLFLLLNVTLCEMITSPSFRSNSYPVLEWKSWTNVSFFASAHNCVCHSFALWHDPAVCEMNARRRTQHMVLLFF